jgi:hypothetical protein
MVQLLGHRSVDEINYGYSFAKWDMSKIEAIDPNPDGGISFTPYDLHRGYAIRGDHLLTRVQKNGPKRSIPDFEHVRLHFVSDKLKDIIESFEPNIHQFFPVDVFWEDGEFASRKYFFNVCTRIDSVDRERTTMQMVGHLWRPVEGGDNRLVFSTKAIGNAKIWCDKHFDASLIIADQVATAIKSAGITGVSMRHCDQT